jgi:hypothetical protein
MACVIKHYIARLPNKMFVRLKYIYVIVGFIHVRRVYTFERYTHISHVRAQRERERERENTWSSLLTILLKMLSPRPEAKASTLCTSAIFPFPDASRSCIRLYVYVCVIVSYVSV